MQASNRLNAKIGLLTTWMQCATFWHSQGNKGREMVSEQLLKYVRPVMSAAITG